jgi:thiamine biosynthesis protein ThiI
MKAVCLVSGGIDSPTATYLAITNGFEPIILHCRICDHTLPKIEKFCKMFAEMTGKEIKFYYLNQKRTMLQFGERCDKRFGCILSRRFMHRYAVEICKRENADAIITGDSLGQVASQTPENILVETELSEYPIVMPLIGYNKDEIINMAKKIDTYNLSITGPDCPCSFFPGKPRTKARMSEIVEQESRIDVDKIISDGMKSLQFKQISN